MKEKDRIWTSLPRLTPSSVGDLACSLKFDTLRVRKQWPKRGPNEAASRGTAVHGTLHDLYARRSGGQLDLSSIEPLARAHVHRARWLPGTDREAETQAVAAAVCLYVANEDSEDVEATLDLERGIEFEYVHCEDRLVCISATLDRTLCRPSAPSRLVVKEYKTGSPYVDLRECLLLLWCAKVYRPGYRQYALEMDFIDAADGQVTRQTVESSDLRGQLRLLTQAIYAALRSGEPVAEPSEEVCRYCVLRPSCQHLPCVSLGESDDVF